LASLVAKAVIKNADVCCSGFFFIPSRNKKEKNRFGLYQALSDGNRIAEQKGKRIEKTSLGCLDCPLKRAG
jgi:hypothetical protein